MAQNTASFDAVPLMENTGERSAFWLRGLKNP